MSEMMSANIYGSTDITIAEDMLKPDRRRQVSYRKMYIITLFLDLIQIGFSFMLSQLHVPDEFSSQKVYNMEQINKIMLIFLIDHVPASFQFLYVYVCIKYFPNVEIASQQPLEFCIEVLQASLMFASFHVKMFGRQQTQMRLDPLRKRLHNIFGRDMYARSMEEQYISFCTNYTLMDFISVVVQTLIFKYAVSSTGINRVVLYPVTIAVFFLSFLISFFFQMGRNSQVKVMLHPEQLKQISKLVLTQAMYFGIVGLVQAAFSDAIFSIWNALAAYTNQLNIDQAALAAKDETYTAKIFPRFQESSASSLVSTFMTYSLVTMNLFSYYLSTPNAAFIKTIEQIQVSKQNQIIQATTSKIQEFWWLVKDFVFCYRRRLLVDVILMGICATQNFSELVTLAFMLVSGAAFTSNALRKISGTLSFVLVWALIACYVCLIMVQFKKRIRTIGFLSFIAGMVAIPALFSQDVIRDFILDMFPESAQVYVNNVINEMLIPFTAVISFVQQVPVMFPQICVPTQYDEIDEQCEATHDEVCAIQRIVNDNHVFGGVTEGYVYNSFIDLPDFEDVYQASKYAKASFDALSPRQEKRWLPECVEDKMWLNQILVEKRKFGVAIGVRGSHSLLDIGLGLIYAIPEWLIATFGPNIPLEYDAGKYTFVNVFLLKRAEAIYRIISKMTFDKDRVFFITGHH